jgi:hypothetical protein
LTRKFVSWCQSTKHIMLVRADSQFIFVAVSERIVLLLQVLWRLCKIRPLTQLLNGLWLTFEFWDRNLLPLLPLNLRQPKLNSPHSSVRRSSGWAKVFGIWDTEQLRLHDWHPHFQMPKPSPLITALWRDDRHGKFRFRFHVGSGFPVVFETTICKANLGCSSIWASPKLSKQYCRKP